MLENVSPVTKRFKSHISGFVSWLSHVLALALAKPLWPL